MSAEEVEAVLADFRAWLSEARAAAPEPAPPFDVAGVLQQFIALRHEINLQTKTNRTQIEQTGRALALLEQSLAALKGVQPIMAEAQEERDSETQRPLLKTLIDVYDALAHARREMQRRLDRGAGGMDAQAPPAIKIWVPYWARWLGLHELIEKQLAPLHAWHAARGQPQNAGRDLQAIEALLAGYQMGLDRIDRALARHGVEPISCAGAPFDPETMEVAEVVREPGRAGTVVLEELRRGYRWHGRLFRFAQVRVAAPAVGS